jgi:diguanylate cyclase (GGDEF)-like protein
MDKDSVKEENNERHTINLLEKRVYDLQNLADLGIGLVSNLDSKNLVDAILSGCVSHFFVDRAAVILPDDADMNGFRMHSSRGYDRTITDQKIFFTKESPIASFLENSSGPVEYSQCAAIAALKDDIEKLGVLDPWMIVPLMTDHSLAGLLIIGKKIIDKIISDGELEILKGFARFASVAIENSRKHRMAALDSITYLYSFHYFREVLADEMRRSMRYNKDLSLLIIEIDRFEQFTDEHGIKPSEHLMKGCACALRNFLRNTDILARYGKGSFALILTETDTQGAQLVADRIRKKIDESSFAVDSEPVHATGSIGMAHFNPVIDSSREIFMERTERALEKAKQYGNSCMAAQ